jgi:hypothetical protein
MFCSRDSNIRGSDNLINRFEAAVSPSELIKVFYLIVLSPSVYRRSIVVFFNVITAFF